MEGSSVLCLPRVALGLLLLQLSGLTRETTLALLCHLVRSQFPAFSRFQHFSAKVECVFKLMYFYLNRCWSVTY